MTCLLSSGRKISQETIDHVFINAARKKRDDIVYFLHQTASPHARVLAFKDSASVGNSDAVEFLFPLIQKDCESGAIHGPRGEILSLKDVLLSAFKRAIGSGDIDMFIKLQELDTLSVFENNKATLSRMSAQNIKSLPILQWFLSDPNIEPETKDKLLTTAAMYKNLQAVEEILNTEGSFSSVAKNTAFAHLAGSRNIAKLEYLLSLGEISQEAFSYAYHNSAAVKNPNTFFWLLAHDQSNSLDSIKDSILGFSAKYKENHRILSWLLQNKTFTKRVKEHAFLVSVENSNSEAVDTFLHERSKVEPEFREHEISTLTLKKALQNAKRDFKRPLKSIYHDHKLL